MKIVIVNNLYPPYAQGGTEAVVQTTIKLLRDQGHQVTLLTTTPDKTSERWSINSESGFNIYRFHPNNLYYYTDGQWQPVWKKILWHAFDVANPLDKSVITSILREVNPDLVHGHNLKGMSYTLPNVCSQLNIPYVHTIHNYQLLHPFGTFTFRERPPFFRPKFVAMLYQWANRRLFKSVRNVISPTTLPLKMHQRVGFFRSARTSIMPSSVTIPQKNLYPQDSGRLRFVYLGALEEIKGIRVLLQAVMQLPTHFQLDIYGQGSLEEELRTITRKLESVRWLGHLQDKELLGEYDALIYPSICYETQGLAMVEALIRGTPVIASNIGSIPETVADGKNGWLFPAGDAKALSSLLNALIANPTTTRKMRANAKTKTALSDPSTYAQKLLTVYTASIQNE